MFRNHPAVDMEIDEHLFKQYVLNSREPHPEHKIVARKPNPAQINCKFTSSVRGWSGARKASPKAVTPSECHHSRYSNS